MTERILQELANIQAAAAELNETLNGLASTHVLYTSLQHELAQIDRNIAELKEATKNLYADPYTFEA